MIVTVHVFVEGHNPIVQAGVLHKKKKKEKSSPEDFIVGWRARNDQILLWAFRYGGTNSCILLYINFRLFDSS